MPKPRKRNPKQKSETLGEALVNLFFPARYEPPPGRQATCLPGWSGLETDPKPDGTPGAWGGPSSWS